MKKTNYVFEDKPLYNSTLIQRIILFFIPKKKWVTIDGTIYWKKFRGIVFITKYEAQLKSEE